MSVANFPSKVLTYIGGSAINTIIPAVPLNSVNGTSLSILRRADGSEIVFNLPDGVYNLYADCTLNIANAETAVQQIELQIVTLNGAGVVQNRFASNIFTATRNPPNATFAAVANVAYHLQCEHSSVNVVAGQNYGIRCVINGNPIGGSTISNTTFAMTKVGDLFPFPFVFVV
jgi:hypothetical protein